MGEENIPGSRAFTPYRPHWICGVMISIKLEAGKVPKKVNDIVSDGNLIYDHTGNQHWKKSIALINEKIGSF